MEYAQNEPILLYQYMGIKDKYNSDSYFVLFAAATVIDGLVSRDPLDRDYIIQAAGLRCLDQQTARALGSFPASYITLTSVSFLSTSPFDVILYFSSDTLAALPSI